MTIKNPDIQVPQIEPENQKIKSKILSQLFKEVNKEELTSNNQVIPKAQYVRGAHTQGVYHKQYNRY